MIDPRRAGLSNLPSRPAASAASGCSAAAPNTATGLLQQQTDAMRLKLFSRWLQTQREDAERSARRVNYLSMEFLMGRAMRNALDALGCGESFAKTCAASGLALSQVLEREPDAALGNGGLGRLAACFLDSMAELGLPSFGYGLHYDFGMFAQRIEDGRQTEWPDDWKRFGALWEWSRPELRYRVGFGGHVSSSGFGGRDERQWFPAETVIASAVDFVVPAHHGERVSTLRQWKAGSDSPLDFTRFSSGDHLGAAQGRLQAERLTWVLYPDDSTVAGHELRLRQEYLLVSASLQDILSRHLQENGSLASLAEKVAIHLNDTHPALAVPELLRLLTDEHGMHWTAAVDLCERVFSYTNHTLMPEALESWPVEMFGRLLPRHLEIVYALNAQFLSDIRARFPGDEALIQRLSLIDEVGERRVRMAHLSILLSHKVNGVSALHSRLMVDTIFADFARVFPGRFCNVTNGVTPRRWLAQCNSALSTVLDTELGARWRQDATRLRQLVQPGAVDVKPSLMQAIMAAKLHNKRRVAELIARELGLQVNPYALFDVQAKRIHEYKRQLLNLLQVVARYHAICDHPDLNWVPRVVIFAGKAASAYVAAKTIIRLIHDVARVVNSDPRIGDRLKVAFLPNYSVSQAEVLIPGADLSEQISTAGTEASGTGNMKFALNGALTIGTWDGANIEMAERMGAENMFIFGLRAHQVAELKAQGYEPRNLLEGQPRLARVLGDIRQGVFSPGEPDRYHGLMDSLIHHDPYLLLADFEDYWDKQTEVDALFANPTAWGQRVVHNMAGMGHFSSDRTVAEYARQIWAMGDAVHDLGR